MEYFKICPKCGAYMSPHLGYNFGYVYTDWICSCGYFESTGSTSCTYSTGTKYDPKQQSVTSSCSHVSEV